MIIRPYQKSDRSMVRQVCCDTADNGQPVEGFFPDRQLAADLLSLYYTDFEPESIFVAQSEGRLIGYVLGSLNNRRYGLAMFWILIPLAAVRGFARGTFFRRQFWRFVFGMGRNWRRVFVWRKEFFHSHQGHVHIGVAAEHQGRHVGRALLQAFLGYAAGHGAQEVMASVHSNNVRACRFFETLGFKPRGRQPMWTVRGSRLVCYDAIAYVKSLP